MVQLFLRFMSFSLPSLVRSKRERSLTIPEINFENSKYVHIFVHI